MRTYSEDVRRKHAHYSRSNESERIILKTGFVFGGLCFIAFGAILLLMNIGAAIMTMLAGAIITGYSILYFKKD